MKPIISISISFLSFFSLQAQTFVESFLKNKDSITVYHNGDGKEMIPVVRFYLFADDLVPDTSGRIDADRLLSQWNQYVLGKTTSIYYMYRQEERKPNDFYYGSLTIEGEDKDGKRFELPWKYPIPFGDILEPDLIVKPSIVYFSPENDPFDSVDFWDGCYSCHDNINHHCESKYSRRKFKERKVVCFDLCVANNNGWFLKGDSLYTGYVLDTASHRMRLRTVQEALDDMALAPAHYFNRIDSTCLIPVEKRQKIACILDDEISEHSSSLDNGGLCGPINHYDMFGYPRVSCEEAYRKRGKENQYFGHIEYRRFHSKKDCMFFIQYK